MIMCPPTAIAIGFTVASTALSMANAVQAGQSQARVSETNARALETQAAYRQEKAKFDAAQVLTKYQRVRGKQIAGAAASGIDIASFSDALADSTIESALEVKAIRYQGTLEANNLLFQAAGERNEADGFRRAGTINAVAAGLQGGARLAGQIPTSTSVSSPWETSVSFNNRA
jgi:hypothetical protein